MNCICTVAFCNPVEKKSYCSVKFIGQQAMDVLQRKVHAIAAFMYYYYYKLMAKVNQLHCIFPTKHIPLTYESFSCLHAD